MSKKHRELIVNQDLYDFDYSSLLIVMGCQLKNIERALIEGHAVHSSKVLRGLRTCILLCERILYHDYMHVIKERLEYSKKKLPNDSISFTNVSSENVLRRFRKQYDLSNRLQEYDKELLFKLMNKYLFRWWD